MSYLADSLNGRSVSSDHHQLDLLYDQEELLNFLNDYADAELLDHDG